MITSHAAPAPSSFDPGDPAFVADPYPTYAEMRAAGRILYDERTDKWLVPHHADVNALLRDRRFGRTYLHAASHAEMGRSAEPQAQAPFWHLIRSGILDMEPPDHTRVRTLVSKAFTPRTVERLRPRIEALVERLVERVAGGGEFDLIAEIAEPLPVTVIAELLGIPEADRHLLRPWSAEICLMYELNPSDDHARRAVRASEEFSAYLRELLSERRTRPGEDLVSSLAQVVDGGERLTADELIGTCVLLLNAGHEASVNGAGNGWWSLFRHPQQLALLRDEPGVMATAADELLRFDTPLQLFERWVLEDAEVCGVTVPRGAELGLLFGSANRDPAAFDRPEELDVRRSPNPHVSFGAGIHYCLGAPLARLELQLSFGILLRRIPTMQLVAEPDWKPGYIIRGLRQLRVRG